MITLDESNTVEYYCSNCGCVSHCGEVCEEPIGVGVTDKVVSSGCPECKCPLCDYTEKMKYGS